MKHLVLFEQYKPKTDFYDVPQNIYNKLQKRSYSYETNMKQMAVFRAKDNNEYVIHNPINTVKFSIYILSELDKATNTFPESIATALFHVNYSEGYITGSTSNQSIEVKEEYRRLGIATAITDFVENLYQMVYKPTSVLSPEMQGFVDNRFS